MANSAAGGGQIGLQRLRDFLLCGAAGRAREASRLDRFATIACLVLALMGCCISRRRWRTLWPTCAIFAAVTLSDMSGLIPATSRLPIEPLAFLWAALAVTPPLARLLAGRGVRVYRPGERAEDPFGPRHVLHGPHYEVGMRRQGGMKCPDANFSGGAANQAGFTEERRPFAASATFAFQLVLDRLTFLKAVEAGFGYRRMMEEDFSAFARDEPKSPIRNKLRNLALRHRNNSSTSDG